MPVNGFSFLSEKFLPIIAQQPLCTACMSEFVQKKRGTAAPGSAFDIRPDRGVPEEMAVARSGSLRNFVPHGRNRTRKPMPRDAFQESHVLFASLPKEKIARSRRFRQNSHASFPRFQVARTN